MENRMVQAAEICERAATRLEQGWCQGVLATNGKGRGVLPDNPTACRFCIIGAIFSANYDFSDEAAHLRALIFDALEQITGSPSIPGWNDTPGRTQAEVVDVMKRTAQYFREQSQTQESKDD